MPMCKPEREYENTDPVKCIDTSDGYGVNVAVVGILWGKLCYSRQPTASEEDFPLSHGFMTDWERQSICIISGYLFLMFCEFHRRSNNRRPCLGHYLSIMVVACGSPVIDRLT